MKKSICMLFGVLLISICLMGCQKVVVYEDYQGPNLPLSAVSDTEGIVAERNMECDYSNYDYSNNSTRKVKIHDQYVLTNTTSKDIVLDTVYGFAGDYGIELAIVPKMMVNEKEVSTNLVVGRSTSRYMDKLEKEEGNHNTDAYTLHNRECFEMLLEDGVYQREAIEAAVNVPAFPEKVKVYKFEDVGYAGNSDKISSPCAEIAFEFDPEKTEVYCYGMNSCDEVDGVTSLGFDVPEKKDTDFGKDVYLIAVGDELAIRDVKCYATNSKKEAHLTDEYTVEFDEYESTLDKVFEEIVSQNKEEHRPLAGSKTTLYDKLTAEQVLIAGKQYVSDMRELDYNGEKVLRLENYLFEFYGDFRVFYQMAKVTVPANDSVVVTLEYEKYTGIKKIDGKDYDGLEIMTTLGSNLDFSNQTLKVVGVDDLDISQHTTGEELEKGQHEVELDGTFFEIYLEVPKRNP